MKPIIDTNVYLGSWPFRRLYGSRLDELLEKLRASGTVQAWAGSYDGLWQRDLADVNEQLAKTCAGVADKLLVPFGAVNPTLPNWQDDVRRCHELHKMPGIRLNPNYHGYKLDAPEFAELLAEAERRGLIVQIALSMEDERTQPALARAPHVDATGLGKLLAATPKLRVVILNGFRAMRIEQASKLATAGQVWFDIAMLESVEGVSKLIAAVGLDRIVFGSHFPFFYYESAVLKLQESALAHEAWAAVAEKNARALLAQSA
ncbi:MAG: amidohydrolase family protein [Planctomycetes bacterium]|nr:amidohydrolase family protein [Planctomycetota bacterium]